MSHKPSITETSIAVIFGITVVVATLMLVLIGYAYAKYDTLERCQSYYSDVKYPQQHCLKLLSFGD